MIALRTKNNIDGRSAPDDLFAFGLGDAAGDGDHQAAARGGGGLLQAPQPAELGVDLLGRLFADVAGVENDEIGIFGAKGLDIALRHQGVGHTTRIVDVHLAAERLDIDFAGQVHTGVEPKPLS